MWHKLSKVINSLSNWRKIERKEPILEERVGMRTNSLMQSPGWTTWVKAHTKAVLEISLEAFTATTTTLPVLSEVPISSSCFYPWLPMVVGLFLTHLLLQVASPITFPPSPFHYHISSRSKGLHWWRRSKAYKLYMELHYVVSDHVHLGNVLLLPLSFVSSIYFNSLFFIIFSMYLLHFLVVWCCLE